MTAASEAYCQKPATYFAGARRAFVDDLPRNSKGRLIEIGCGNGDTAAYAHATGKCGWSAGIELCGEPAAQARQKMGAVLVADVETVELPWPDDYFDVLIMSEVLEHLRDPWLVLKRMYRVLRPSAWVLSGSPNVAHHSVLRMLLRGCWDYSPVGIMDHTHLRWFTPGTYRKMFESCGYRVVSVDPATSLRAKARLFNAVTGGRFRHLLHTQIYLKARK